MNITAILPWKVKCVNVYLRWIHLLSDILRRTLKTLGELPDRNSKRLIHILQGCEEVLLDGTERPIQRPLDEDRQSACYSGKKNS